MTTFYNIFENYNLSFIVFEWNIFLLFSYRFLKKDSCNLGMLNTFFYIILSHLSLTFSFANDLQVPKEKKKIEDKIKDQPKAFATKEVAQSPSPPSKLPKLVDPKPFSHASNLVS